VIALLPILALATAPACERPIENPQWVRKPTAENIEAVIPRTTEPPTEAETAMTCSVHAAGELYACVIVRERPAEASFGEALLALAPEFVLSPGEAGRCVSVRVRWTD